MNAIPSSIRDSRLRSLLLSIATVALIGLLPRPAATAEFDGVIPSEPPGGASVEVNTEQMHQLDIAPAKARALTTMKAAIGQIRSKSVV